MKRKKTERFPLLIYQAIAKRWRGPAFLLIPAGIVLWWGVRRPNALNTSRAWLGLLLSIVGALIFLYTFRANHAGIHCHTDHFTIMTPLYPVVFSYRRIKAVRPMEFATIFSPQEEKPARQRIYQKLWGKTAVIIDLKGYPIPERWLHLWFHNYLLHPKLTSLVVLTDDWMALTRQLEMRRTEMRQVRRPR
jgi:hypothetical protein